MYSGAIWQSVPSLLSLGVFTKSAIVYSDEFRKSEITTVQIKTVLRCIPAQTKAFLTLIFHVQVEGIFFWGGATVLSKSG